MIKLRDASHQPRAALYLGVSTVDQHVDNQAHELRTRATTAAGGWSRNTWTCASAGRRIGGRRLTA